MSLRFKSLTAAVGISLTLWAVLIQGGITLYRSASGGSLSETAMITENVSGTRVAGF